MDSARALEATRTLLASLADLAADWERMPFFVRPMARGGFERRTGARMEQWEKDLGDLARALETGKPAGPFRSLVPRLERMIESFRTAPERASRFMGSARLDEITAKSRVREEAARAVWTALKEW